MYLIKKLRENKGISQGKLAKMLGISLRTVQHYEAGTTGVPLKKLKIISEFFNVDVSEFYKSYDEESKIYDPEIDLVQECRLKLLTLRNKLNDVEGMLNEIIDQLNKK